MISPTTSDDQKEICYDSEPERIKYYQQIRKRETKPATCTTTTTTTTTATTTATTIPTDQVTSKEPETRTTPLPTAAAAATTTTTASKTNSNETETAITTDTDENDDDLESEPVNHLKNIISKFRHQATTTTTTTTTKKRTPSTSSSSSSSISLLNKDTRKKLTIQQDQELLSIDYPSLLRLNKCPVCNNPWITYKAPKSKLIHIRLCATQELIPQRHLTQRVQAVLEEQAQQQHLKAGLIDRHLNTSSHLLARSDQPYPQPSHETSNQNAPNSTNQPKNPTKALSISSSSSNLTKKSMRPKPDSAPDSAHSFRSSALQELQQQTKDRNAQVNTKNHDRSYSLWELASGHDDYPYDRSVVSSISHLAISQHTYPRLTRRVFRS
jgi:hypothetical protein